MPYIINTTNNAQIAVVADGTVDNTLDIKLIGKNYVGYGEAQNENLVFMLENFSSSIAPTKPLTGQLWYNSTLKTINVYTGTVWKQIGSADISDTQPVYTENGSFWFNTTTQQLFVKVAGTYKFVGPETAPGFGDTRAVSTTIRDAGRNPKPIIKIVVDNTIIAIVSKTSFTILNDDAISGFNILSAGITLSDQCIVKGSLTGVASSATKLDTARTINGVPFDGTADIVVSGQTQYSLVPGSGLIGSTFTGASQVNISVDASSANLAGKVVSRDSSGNFSAGTISAVLIGNVRGNLTGNVIGNVSGNVSGNVLGNLTGNVTGNVTGSLFGNANTSTKLASPVKINNIDFDGSANITISDTSKVPLVGGTMTGPLVLNAKPTDRSQAANKAYVDDALGGISVVPRGLISMWYGSIASIPGGYGLCDGTNGTPDLRDRFVLGAGGSYSVSATGGTKDTVLPSHSHSASFNGNSLPNHSHSQDGYNLISDAGGSIPFYNWANNNKARNSTETGSSSAGTPSGSVTIGSTGSNPTDTNLPPYYVLAYIMKL